MKTFSLISVTKEIDEHVFGYWVQDHIGDLDSAAEYAKRTSEVNGGQDIAVVDAVTSTTPALLYYENLKRLN